VCGGFPRAGFAGAPKDALKKSLRIVQNWLKFANFAASHGFSNFFS